MIYGWSKLGKLSLLIGRSCRSLESIVQARHYILSDRECRKYSQASKLLISIDTATSIEIEGTQIEKVSDFF